MEGRVGDIKHEFCEDLFEIIVPLGNENLQLPDDCEIKEQTSDNKTLTLKVRIPKGRNSDLIGTIMQQTELLSYRELLPSMNDIFIKTVKDNE